MDALALINLAAAVFRALVVYTNADEDWDLEGFKVMATVLSIVTFLVLAGTAYRQAGFSFHWDFWVWASLAITVAAFAKEIVYFSAWLVLREAFRFKDHWSHWRQR